MSVESPTLLKEFRFEENPLKDASIDEARRDGYSTMHLMHIFKATLHSAKESQDPYVAELFPDGLEETLVKLESLSDVEVVEPWHGNVEENNRTIAVFEEAERLESLNPGLTSSEFNTLVAVLHEENKGETDVTEGLLKIGLNPYDILHRIHNRYY